MASKKAEKPLDVSGPGVLDAPELASGVWMPLLDTARAYPTTIDEAEVQFGSDIYDRMMNDPYIGGPVDLVREMILGGLSVAPAVGEEHPEFEKASELAQFVKYAFEQIPTHAVLWEMLECIWHGHTVAEITYKKCESGEYAGRYIWNNIRPISRRNYTIVVDQYNKFLGIIGIKPGKSAMIYSGLVGDPNSFQGYVPAQKLWLLNLKSKIGDPRGSSWIRRCYEPWYSTQQSAPLDLRNLGQFVGESIMARLTKPDSKAMRGFPDGTMRECSAAANAAAWLAMHRAGGVTVLPEGVEAEITSASKDSATAFEVFEMKKNRAKLVGFMSTARAIMESTKNSQSDSGDAQDVLSYVVNGGRMRFDESAQNVVYRLVDIAWGADLANSLCPIFQVGQPAHPDFAVNLNAISDGVQKNTITKAMLPAVLSSKCGVTYRPDEEEDEEHPEPQEEPKNEDTDEPNE